MPLHVDSVLTIDQLPPDCITDCGKGGGAKDEAVAYWLERLEFTVDRAKAIECLAGYGAWERGMLEVETDETLASRVLWLAASNFAEWDGKGEDSSQGSNIFVLE